MSDTVDGTAADGTPGRGQDEVSDEVRLDLDEDKLDTWEDVRSDYAVDPDTEMSRPALTETEDDPDDAPALREDDEEDDLAEHDEDRRADEEE